MFYKQSFKGPLAGLKKDEVHSLHSFFPRTERASENNWPQLFESCVCCYATTQPVPCTSAGELHMVEKSIL